MLKAGLEGEKKEVYTEQGSKKVKWVKNGERKPLTWYKVTHTHVNLENINIVL